MTRIRWLNFILKLKKESYVYIYKEILNKTSGNGLVMTHID